MLPHAAHAGQLVLELGQFDLQLALRRVRVGGKDVEDQRGAIDHANLEAILEVALLGGRELIVDDEHLCLGGLELLFELIDLAGAEVGLELGLIAPLDQLPNGFAERRVEEFGELGKIGLDALVLTGDGRDEGALRCGIAYLIEAIAHYDGVYSAQESARAAPIRSIASPRRSSDTVSAMRT